MGGESLSPNLFAEKTATNHSAASFARRFSVQFLPPSREKRWYRLSGFVKRAAMPQDRARWIVGWVVPTLFQVPRILTGGPAPWHCSRPCIRSSIMMGGAGILQIESAMAIPAPRNCRGESRGRYPPVDRRQSLLKACRDAPDQTKGPGCQAKIGRGAPENC